MNDSPITVALLREGALAAQMVGTGVTTLRKAETAHSGLLALAFFSLTIGLERLGKLIVIMDHYLDNSWKFPSDHQLRGLHHDLMALFEVVEKISVRRFSAKRRNPIPKDPVHRAILETLSEFARVTRYQNLDFLVGGHGASMSNAEALWFKAVGELVLDLHYTKQRAEVDDAQAGAVDALLGDAAYALNLGFDGRFRRSIKESMIHGKEAEVVQRYSQFYCLQIARFFSETLLDLEHLAHRAGRDEIPWFSEQIAWFLNDDAYFKSRKTWNP